MQKETLLLVIGLAGVTGWMFREPLMNRINPPPATVNTADLAPADSQYRQSEASASNNTSGIYSWKDKDGKVHFGSRAESEDARAVTLSKSNTFSMPEDGRSARNHDKPRVAKPAPGAGEPQLAAPIRKTEQTLHGAAMKQQAEIGVMNEVNR